MLQGCSRNCQTVLRGHAGQLQPQLQPVRPASSPDRSAAVSVAAVALSLALQGSCPALAHQQQSQPQPLRPGAPEVVQQQWQQQQQPQQPWQQQLHAPELAAQPLAELAGFFDNADPTDPFTLFGTNFKKYQIEQMQGEKVVSRSRGFTVDTCVSGTTASEETPMFNGMSTGAKVEAGDDLLCKRATGSDLKVACKQSCGSACESALAAYEARLSAETGLTLGPKERERVLKNCRHSCVYECTKSGKTHDFVVPSRR